MLLRLLRPVSLLRKVLGVERSPAQISWGIALGVWIGLVPKGNLTAWCLGILLLSLKVNLGAGMLTALVVSSLAQWTDPLTHGIGSHFLGLESIRSQLGRAYDAPIVPWLALNNTVVLGSAMLGLAILYPVKHISESVVRRVLPLIAGSGPPDSDNTTATSDDHSVASSRVALGPEQSSRPSSAKPANLELPDAVHSALRRVADGNSSSPHEGS